MHRLWGKEGCLRKRSRAEGGVLAERGAGLSWVGRKGLVFGEKRLVAVGGRGKGSSLREKRLVATRQKNGQKSDVSEPEAVVAISITRGRVKK